jgi:4'-phosphopantetheinyl transferase
LRFVCGPRGKPALVQNGSDSLQFSVSHSGEYALFAIAAGRAVGVDLELESPQIDPVLLAPHCFSPGEIAQLNALPEAWRAKAFLKGWTCKEAFVKAKGDGVFLELSSFDVCLDPSEPARLLRTGWDALEARRWCLRVLDLGPGVAAAVAAEGSDLNIVMRNFDAQRP